MAIKGAIHADKKSHASPRKDRNKLPPSKVVVRRLPPDMTVETFREQVAPLPDHDYLRFVPPSLALGQHAFSRVYINFLRMDDIINFRDRFDGYVFVDQEGSEYPAVVEFALYQRVPRHRPKKRDPKCGTLSDDPDYRAFLERAENPEEPSAPSWEETLEQIERRQKELRENHGLPATVTPLVSYVVRRRQERREERRRRELERKKEEARRLKEKQSREKRDAREKEKQETKESPKVVKKEDRYRKYDDTKKKKHEEKHKTEWERSNEESYKDKDEKHKRKEKEDRVNSCKDKSAKKEERDRVRKEKEREEKSRERELEDKARRNEKKSSDSRRCSVSGSEGSVGKDTESAPGRGSGDSEPPPAEPHPAKRQDADTGELRDSKTDRKIRNKDRPSLTIYRPGMGKYSSRRLQDRDTHSPSPPSAADPAGPGSTGSTGSGGEEEERQQRRTLVFRRSRQADT